MAPRAAAGADDGRGGARLRGAVRMREPVKALLGPACTTRLRCLAGGYPLPRWGNLRRTRRFSSQFGFERGTPVDRWYLRRFLERHRADITGDVLEIQAPDHAR